MKKLPLSLLSLALMLLVGACSMPDIVAPQPMTLPAQSPVPAVMPDEPNDTAQSTEGPTQPESPNGSVTPRPSTESPVES